MRRFGVSSSQSLFVPAALAIALLSGCAFKTQKMPEGTAGTTGGSSPTGIGGTSAAGTTGAAGTTPPPPPTPCMGLACRQSTCVGPDCQQPPCTNNSITTLSGKVYDPAGKVPLYNADVYIPNAPLKDFTDGPSCDTCQDRLSGSPLTKAVTDASGTFHLGTRSSDVPTGSGIPLVVQIGKWRRQVMLDNVVACQDNALTDPEQTRLARDQSEGHLPRIALTTGGADALECLLLKIGISKSEFTPESASGRVNLFAGGSHNGTAMTMPMGTMGTGSVGTNAYDASLNGGAAFTDAETWWENGENLNLYDIILHSCEGVTDTNDTNKSMNARMAMQAYADAGGRMFASHWHNYWIEHGTGMWPTVANFNHQNDPRSPFTATVDTSFAKGTAFSEWLVNVMASTTPGQLVIQGAKHTVDTVNASAQRWLYSTGPTSTQYFSFATPVGGTACGKVVFSDLHVSSGSGGANNDSSSPSKPFPTGCVTTELSPQEKALEFMLFDLSSCVIPGPG
jgi:hypothetical protein